MNTRTESEAARIPVARWSRVLALLLTGWPLLVSAVRFEFFEPIPRLPAPCRSWPIAEPPDRRPRTPGPP